MPPTGDLAHNLGMCPDWELNWRLFGSQACAQSTGLQQPGQKNFLIQKFQFVPYMIILKYYIHMGMFMCISTYRYRHTQAHKGMFVSVYIH